MKESYKTFINQLIKDKKISQSQQEEIFAKLENNNNFEHIINEYISKDGFASTLVDLYRRQRVDISSIENDFTQDIKEFLKLVSNRFKFTFYNLDSIDIDYRISEKTNLSQLKKFGAMPIKEDEINIYVAFKNPFDLNSQDAIQHIFNRKLLKIVVADPAQIDKYLSKVELNENIKGIINEIRKEISSSANDDSTNVSGILRLIEIILKTSITSRASDIHIEPTETNCIVRSRIDGMLTELFIFDKDIYPPMVSRIKLLSNMDIAERRKPQDGRFSAQILDKEYDFRISTLPVLNGESIVLRILDKSKVIISLDNLGMHPQNLAKFNTAIKSPYGIILVTGPTGSGKTTTLYAALNDLKSITTKIITVEDPVEYQLNMIQQVHVNEKVGLSFSSALRSILRQDPDIIMIGEIRDQETLRIAIQSALTGHLVFSTLHTNDAISSITRMIDMGIEPYLISGSIVCIEAQRLVRKLCPYCKQPINLPDATLQTIEKYLPQNYQFYKNVGCEKCSQTGYLGREMISEILPVGDKMSSLIASNASKDDLKHMAYEEGFIDMFHDGILRAARGITTYEEILRVAKT